MIAGTLARISSSRSEDRDCKRRGGSVVGDVQRSEHSRRLQKKKRRGRRRRGREKKKNDSVTSLDFSPSLSFRPLFNYIRAAGPAYQSMRSPCEGSLAAEATKRKEKKGRGERKKKGFRSGLANRTPPDALSQVNFRLENGRSITKRRKQEGRGGKGKGKGKGKEKHAFHTPMGRP